MSGDILAGRDGRQDRRIEALGESLAGFRGELASQNRALNAQLAQVRGSLDERIDRLSRAFDAFVELSDIRAVLALFTDSALVRHHARALVTSILERADAPTAHAPDVPGYWLAPAVRVARARFGAAEPATTTADLAEALRLDDVRTSVFLCLLAVLTGGPDPAASDGGPGPAARSGPDPVVPDGGPDPAVLAVALGEFRAGVAITDTQRLLWRLCATGRYGVTGRQLIGDRLRGMVAALTGAQREDAARLWRLRADQRPATSTAELAIPDDAAGARDAALAAAQLAGVRELVEPPPVAPPMVAPRPPADPLPGDLLPADLLPGDLLPGDLPPGDLLPAADPVAAEVTALLLTLVDEGTGEEAPLLHRATQLRAIIEGRLQPDTPAWTAAAGDPMTLLVGDAFGAGFDGRGVLARAVGAPWLLAAADSYLARVGTHPPDETGVRTAYRMDVRVRRVGADPGDLATVRSRIDDFFPDPRVPDPPTVALLVAAVLAIGPAALFPPGLAFLLILVGCFLLIGVALRWRAGRQLRVDRRRERRVGHLDLDERTGRAQANLLALAEQLPGWLRTARQDHAAVTAALSDPGR